MILQIQSEKDEPNSGTSYKSSIFNFYPQNLLKPDSNPQWINVLYQEHIQYKMLIGKSKYFQVILPWGEPQSYSWSIGYMSTSFRFIYSPRKIPGKRPTNLFVYHVPACLVLPVHALRAICAIYRKQSSFTRWLAHFWKPPTNQCLKCSTFHVCTQN